MTTSRLPLALQSASRPLLCLLVAAAVFAAGSSVTVRADQQLNIIAVKNDPANKRMPNAELSRKLGIRKTTPNPYLSYLPVESRPNHDLWREKMRNKEAVRLVARKTTAQASSNFVALIPVGESESPDVRGLNDSLATAQIVNGFGTGTGDDAAMDITGNLKTPDPVTGFTPDAEDEGDINKASDSTVGDGQAKTASGTVGDGPFGTDPLTVVPIDPSLEDDGDINQANSTGLAFNQVVVADGEIGDGPFGESSGDFDVFSFTVNAPETILIEVNHPQGGSTLDPIVALVDSDGDIVAVNDDRPASVESYLSVTFNCPFELCQAQTFYAFVGGWFGEQTLSEASFPSDRFDSSTGPGLGETGPYELRITKYIVPSGDFDFYSVAANAGDLITVEVDTANFDGELDPIVAIYDSNGNMLALNDDDPNAPLDNFDSYLSLFAPQNDTYFVAVGGFDDNVFPTSPLSFLEDPFDSSSGPGSSVVSTGDYDVIISRNHIDLDFYSFDVDAGDIVGVNVTGATAVVGLYDASGQLLIASGFPIGGNLPASSPLPIGGNAGAAYVAPESASYAVFVGFGEGAYDLEVRAFRPPQEATGTTQRLFIDFDGASVDTSKFGADPGHPQPSSLSSLASFLPAWGLTPGDENAVIDAILAVVQQNLSSDIRLTGNNPAFDIEILNSRDHADPFGEPDVSRVIVGGTINESDIATIGIAESIDIGNFEQAEDSLVLLDLLSNPAGDPNSLNDIALGAASKIELLGEGVGNIVAHEAGHFFANFHTNNANLIPNLMDTGGNLPGLIGVGDDDTFGSGDDVDVNFVSDEYEPSEGLTGLEDTKNAIAYALTAGPAVGVPLLLRRSTDNKWFMYEMFGSTIADKGFVDGLTRSPDYGVVSRADFDGDGEADVLVRDMTGNQNGKWVLSILDGKLLETQGFPDLTRNSDWVLMATEDFDADDKSDVLLRNAIDGRWLLYLLDGLTIKQQGIVALSTTLTDAFLGTGDFNGDGRTDVLLRRANGTWLQYLLNGVSMPTSAAPAMTSNLSFTVEALEDFSGDGNTDVLLRRTDGRWFMYLLDGSTVHDSGSPAMTENTAFSFEASSDFNGDGSFDILIRRDDGRWFMYVMNGIAIANSGSVDMTRNLEFQIVSTQDFNSDGNADVLQRRSDGRWVLYSMDGPAIIDQSAPDLTRNSAFEAFVPY
jgi:hypothetical protein